MCLFVSGNLFAAYLRNIKRQVEQPDGTIINVFLTGDENFSFLHDEERFTIIRDSRTRFYCWARQGEDGELESTGFPIHLHDPKELGLEPGETISPERRRLRTRYFPHNENIQGRSDSRNTPSTGDINQVVIFEQLTINSHLYPISGTANIISYQSPSVRDYFQPYQWNQEFS